MSERAELNARLRQLGRETPFAYGEWVAAAMWLGDKAEAALPAVEALCAAGWAPERAAVMVLEVGGLDRRDTIAPRE